MHSKVWSHCIAKIFLSLKINSFLCKSHFMPKSSCFWEKYLILGLCMTQNNDTLQNNKDLKSRKSNFIEKEQCFDYIKSTYSLLLQNKILQQLLLTPIGSKVTQKISWEPLKTLESWHQHVVITSKWSIFTKKWCVDHAYMAYWPQRDNHSISVNIVHSTC